MSNIDIGPAPVLDQNYDSIIIVDGLPVVDTGKVAKLTDFVTKKFVEHGTIVESELVLSDDGSTTLGYMFIRYETPAQAKAALALDEKPMDRKHTFRVSLFNDYENNYAKVPEVYEEPDEEMWTSKPHPPLQGWLLDPSLRDQFVIRSAKGDDDETVIYWNDPLRKADTYGREVVYDGHRETSQGRVWCTQRVQFSPSGSYLVTFHGPGIALCGGDDFERITRLVQRNINWVMFSPCERFVVTMNITDVKNSVGEAILWKVDGTLVKKFPNSKASDWPVVQFSHDGNYLCRVSAGGIAIIDTSTMQIVGGKPISAPNCSSVSWSPISNVISYFLPSKTAQPDRVILFDVEKSVVVREKHIFNVVNCSLHWQESGEHFYAVACIKKSKKLNGTSVFIFDLHSKDIPIEDLALDLHPGTFLVDPVNGSFATLSPVYNHQNTQMIKVDLSVYKLTTKSAKKIFNLVTPVVSSDDGLKSFRLLWSPAGNYLLFGTQTSDLSLNIINCDLETPAIVAGDLQHTKTCDISWDPSGRYFTTSSLRPFKNDNVAYNQQWKSNSEDAYKIWSFQGNLLAEVPVQKLFQFMWRPRPKNVITKKQSDQVKADLKKVYWKKFDAQDEDLYRTTKSEYTRRRAAIKQSWKEYKAQCVAYHAQTRDQRIDLREGLISDDEDNIIEIEEWITTTEVVEEPVKNDV